MGGAGEFRGDGDLGGGVLGGGLLGVGESMVWQWQSSWAEYLLVIVEWLVDGRV
jgi:hypothetical protein